jgi:hypothetical protein
VVQSPAAGPKWGEQGDQPRGASRRGRRCSARWSWRNQLIAVLPRHADARGFRQWHLVGRTVRKGQHAFYILAPIPVRRTAGEAAAGDPDESPGLRRG